MDGYLLLFTADCCYLDAGEGDGGGGVGSDHQSDERRPQVSKHAGELKRRGDMWLLT